MIVFGLGEKYNEIKWNKRRSVETKKERKTSSAPFNIIPDDFPPHVQGKLDIQSGIILTCRSEYKRKLKEKGLVQI